MRKSAKARDRLKARIETCVGERLPQTFEVRVEDNRAQSNYAIAAGALEMKTMSSFFQYAAEYIIAYHPGLKDVRRVIRRAELRITREKKARERGHP